MRKSLSRGWASISAQTFVEGSLTLRVGLIAGNMTVDSTPARNAVTHGILRQYLVLFHPKLSNYVHAERP